MAVNLKGKQRCSDTQRAPEGLQERSAHTSPTAAAAQPLWLAWGRSAPAAKLAKGCSAHAKCSLLCNAGSQSLQMKGARHPRSGSAAEWGFGEGDLLGNGVFLPAGGC